MLEFIDQLKAADVFRDQDILGVRTIEPIVPTYADEFPQGIDPDVSAAVREVGIDRLFEHQAGCIEAMLAGEDVVLVSPTATGKTMCFNIPIISALKSDPHAHALYLYPMKALANDQMAALKAITGKLIPKHSVSSWTFDGDTPEEDRKQLKKAPPNIIITNPDSLHYAMLAWNEQWTTFFKSLRYIVLDEAHEYRGYFGINVAYVMRRLLALCASLGSHPQIIVSSATIANPNEHATAITGRKMTLVSGENAGRCRKHWVFVSPDYRDFQYESLLLHKLALMTATCLEQNKSALIFCPTRKFVERVNKVALAELDKRGLDKSAIAPYKSGYTADERRQIESGLKDGTILVVFSTNALEVGIDMGRLDMVVLVGFPDTVMSAWQRAGRAGRSFDKDALVLFLASRSAIDQFYVNNIDLFMKKPLDRLAVNLTNEEVVKLHAPCALFELQGAKQYLTPEIVGEPLFLACEAINPDLGIMKIMRPERQVDLRAIFGQVHTIRVHGTKDEKEIGTTSGDKLFSEVYVGAIYDHYGRSWRVTSHGASEIYVEPNSANHYTNPMRFWFIQPIEIGFGQRWRGERFDIALFFGKVQATDTLTGYREFDEKSNELVDQVNYQSTLSNAFRTEAAWMQLEFHQGVPLEERFPTAHTLEHALRISIPLAIPCDPYDLPGLTVKEGQLGVPTVFLYDTVRGGIGIAKELFRSFREIIGSSRQVLNANCCESACPRCVQLRRCPESNESLDRSLGAAAAEELFNLLGTPPEHFDPLTVSWIS